MVVTEVFGKKFQDSKNREAGRHDPDFRLCQYHSDSLRSRVYKLFDDDWSLLDINRISRASNAK